MSHNERSKVISVRIDHDALAVLEWEARESGVPLRTTIRGLLEERAESISKVARNLKYSPSEQTVESGD